MTRPPHHKTPLKTPTHSLFEGCVAASECTDGTHNCAHATGICSELEYGYECSCVTGYEGLSLTDRRGSSSTWPVRQTLVKEMDSDVMTLTNAPLTQTCAQHFAINTALIPLDHMNAFAEKVTRRNLAMKLLTNRTIALTLTNVHLERIIVTCLLIALTRNLYGHANVTMGIMATAIIAPKSIIVSRIHVLSILNASV